MARDGCFWAMGLPTCTYTCPFTEGKRDNSRHLTHRLIAMLVFKYNVVVYTALYHNFDTDGALCTHILLQLRVPTGMIARAPANVWILHWLCAILLYAWCAFHHLTVFVFLSHLAYSKMNAQSLIWQFLYTASYVSMCSNACTRVPECANLFLYMYLKYIFV